MKRRKVVAFFILLLIFASVLTLFQIMKFGGLLGFVGFNGDSTSTGDSNVNGNVFGYFLLIFVFILFAGLIVRFIQFRNEISYDRNRHARRKLIPIELE
jgi:hypothetical protein